MYAWLFHLLPGPTWFRWLLVLAVLASGRRCLDGSRLPVDRGIRVLLGRDPRRRLTSHRVFLDLKECFSRLNG